MNILFIGCLYSDTQKHIFEKNSIRGYQYAAQNLQEALIEGFIENEIKIEVLSIPSLSTYPFGYKELYVDDAEFIYKGEKLGNSIGFRNVRFIKKINKSLLLKCISSWYQSANEGERYIFVYGLHLNLMRIAVNIKKMYSDVKLCIVVPDLPRFMGCNKYFKLFGLKEKETKEIYDLINLFDCFVLLAEPMANDLNISTKQYTVVEGIYNSNFTIADCKKESLKNILYTGNINEKYGIYNLLYAFERIKDPNYRLWIRGNGNTFNEILKRSKIDSRIVYFDRMSQIDLVKLQKKATLLVNPVPPSQEFTRYFFPSKTMDYLASGTPVLMFKLDCLPKEYHKHLYFWENENINYMSERIVQICEKPQSELYVKGKLASEFIYKHKSPKQQVKKIITLLNCLHNENSNS